MKKNIDVLIIGAGISGIGTAAHLSKKCPQQAFCIVESRENIGGTWNLFRYPGIRSDSDMSTFGYEFKPWKSESVLASGKLIEKYLAEVVEEFDLTQKIYFKHRVVSANFDNHLKKWVVEIIDAENKKQCWTANFIVGCTGYYSYEHGFTPKFSGQMSFKGELIHPQQWSEQLDYSDKKVIIIGSGATAMTLVPALVKGGAKHVTLLQRSPTYVVSVPSVDKIYQKMRQILPDHLAYKITRVRNIAVQRGIYALAQKYPKLVRKFLLKSVAMQLPDQVDIKHFTPSYAPWDQRLCVVPDGDLFKALHSGQADIVTDQIEAFNQTGILLKSRTCLNADIIVTATGLDIQILGGIKCTVDGKPIYTSKHMLYHGIMMSNIPNLAIMIGYINASWTLKVDIAADYVCRLLNYMSKHQYNAVVAQSNQTKLTNETIMGSLSSGYIARAANIMPKQGENVPWKMTNNYLVDRKALKHAKFNDGILNFSK